MLELVRSAMVARRAEALAVAVLALAVGVVAGSAPGVRGGGRMPSAPPITPRTPS